MGSCWLGGVGWRRVAGSDLPYLRKRRRQLVDNLDRVGACRSVCGRGTKEEIRPHPPTLSPRKGIFPPALECIRARGITIRRGVASQGVLPVNPLGPA